MFCLEMALALILLISANYIILNPWMKLYKSQDVCLTRALDEKTLCRPNCSDIPGHFSLPGMDSCHPWLTCEDYIAVEEKISFGAVKIVRSFT